MRRPNNQAVLTTSDSVEFWLNKLRPGILAVDTETTGLKWKSDRVGGIGLAAGDTAAYFTRDALPNAVLWLSDQAKAERPMVGHNMKFDLHMLRGTFGLRVRYPVHDTMVMSFLLDNRGAPIKSESTHVGHGLKNLAAAFVDPQALEPEDDLYHSVVAAGGKRGKKQWKGDLLMGDSMLVGKYGLLDPWYTLQLYHQFKERIDHWIQPPGNYPPLKELYETEQWLLLALIDMEERGILVRPEFFEQWNHDLKKEIEQIQGRLKEIAGKSINWSSSKQLGELLFNEMGLKPSRWTNSGKPSTDEVSLLNLKHPIGAELLKLRDAEKQQSTYAQGLLAAIEEGRIHTSFRQTGADTGRLSCADPNLQQVPRESGARKGFIPDPGLVLRFADLSQIEMRFAAHIARDPVLMAGFLNDPDFDTHAETARKMWGLTGDPTPQQRKFAKIMNFAMLYGAGINRITAQLVSLLTAREAKRAIKSFGYRPSAAEPPHRTLGQLLLKRYFEEFPAVKKARYEASDEVDTFGFAINELGRHRFLDEREGYKALNTKVQGSAADLAKWGLANVYRELQYSGGHIACLIQVHDEIVYLSDGDPAIDRRVRELMSDRTRFRVPMLADVEGSATNWQEKVEIHLN